MNQLKSEPLATYNVTPVMSDDDIINRAWVIIQARTRRVGNLMSSTGDVKSFLSMANAREPDQARERFGVMFLDSQNALIEYETMFWGTLAQTSVYPREVVRRALVLDAAAVILTHNHPSGNLVPSNADIALTNQLKKALEIIDVRVLDHIITGSGPETVSMAEKGLV